MEVSQNDIGDVFGTDAMGGQRTQQGESAMVDPVNFFEFVGELVATADINQNLAVSRAESSRALMAKWIRLRSSLGLLLLQRVLGDDSEHGAAVESETAGFQENIRKGPIFIA